MLTRVAFALAVVCVAGPALAFEDLRLRPRWSDPATTGDTLDMSSRLERIDALTGQLARTSGAEADSLRIELVRLYRGSPLMKHRVLALEYGDTLRGTEGLRERVFNLHRTYNPWDAREALEDWKDESPESAAPHRRDGMIALEEAAREPHRLTDAQRHFEAAVQSADAQLDDWLGLAVVHVTRGDYTALSKLVEPLLRLGNEEAGPHLLAAVAFEGTGLPSRASREFEAAFERMSPAMRERFEFPLSLAVNSSAALYGSALVERPEPPPVRGWWVRMTEAETQFSDPDLARHAWETGPGEAYLLFGRPIYARTFQQASHDEISAAGPLAPYAATIVRQRGSVERLYGDETMVWLVRVGRDREWPVVFQSLTRFTHWVPSAIAKEEILDPQSRRGPVALEASLPPVAKRDEFELEVRTIGFRVGDGELRIESWVGVKGDAAAEEKRVRLRIFDAAGTEIDRVTRPLGGERSRESLGRRIPDFPAGARGWVHGFLALVGPGRYTALVEILSPEGEILASRDQALHLREKEAHRSGFDVSEILLCDAYAENVPDEGIPPEGWRHERVVIPHPEPALHAGQSRVDFYYEVYGAEVDSTGATRLDVEYELYPARGFDPAVGGGAYVDGELVRPRLRFHFPDERTGRFRGVVVKGTRLDLSEQEPGEYVLLVRIGDRLAQKEIVRVLRFETKGPRS